MIWVQGRT
jgi:SAM-dependent methyltransferase